MVDLSRADLVASQLTQAKIGALPDEKDALLYLLLRCRPGRVIVFCNAISAVSRLRSVLQLLAVDMCALQGSMQQRARLKAIDRFRASERCVLLATDVAARGLDVPGVDYVVHYQLPRSAEVLSRTVVPMYISSFIHSLNPQSAFGLLDRHRCTSTG